MAATVLQKLYKNKNYYYALLFQFQNCPTLTTMSQSWFSPVKKLFGNHPPTQEPPTRPAAHRPSFIIRERHQRLQRPLAPSLSPCKNITTFHPRSRTKLKFLTLDHFQPETFIDGTFLRALTQKSISHQNKNKKSK